MENIKYYTRSFETNKLVFRTMLTGLSKEEYTWREAENKWSILEIVCHLHDEEREDFRARLTSVLQNPGQEFISIDPETWVRDRRYSSQSFDEMLEKFINERQYSINWLSSLRNANWDNVYMHKQIGPMSGAFIISNWLAHDYLHIRQITRIRYNYLKYISGESLHYAGDW